MEDHYDAGADEEIGFVDGSDKLWTGSRIQLCYETSRRVCGSARGHGQGTEKGGLYEVEDGRIESLDCKWLHTRGD